MNRNVKVRMMSTKKRTIALSTVAIVAAMVLFASAPLVATLEAQAFWEGGWHHDWRW